jgi:methionyl aminopeptidase
MYTRVKSTDELAAMRESGRMLATVHQVLARQIAVGMTTQELDSIAADELKRLGGKPAFLGYHGFPASLCVSVNDEVVHGIPGSYQLVDGDIVSMDFGVNYRGMITDAARTVIVGNAAAADALLVGKTKESLDAGIHTICGSTRVGEIAAAVQKVLDGAGYGIVRELVGHGVGHHLHEEPNIPNYGKRSSGPWLQVGMTIAIEPMATAGRHHIYVDGDGWTVKTKDESRSAHFEDTVLITETGSEVLTNIDTA